jgi:outer membrane lipoprotein-sorting protein
MKTLAVQGKSFDCINEIEAYFNEITTFESDFVQIDKREHGSLGHFLLKRPYRMKMDYKKPPTHLIIAKRNKIIHYDRELNEKTETSTYSSPLSFLLEKKVNLRKYLKILLIQNAEDSISIKLCKKDDDSEGAITLVFSKKPLTLRKWIVFDDKDEQSPDQGTEISLINWKRNHEIPDNEFEKY